jgi:hypothetical protein
MRPASADKEETPDRFSRDYRRQTKQSLPRSSDFDFREGVNQVLADDG